MMNRVQIMGNLGKDPEIKVTNGGKTVARLSVAVNRKYTDSQGEEKQYTEWVNVVACWKGRTKIESISFMRQRRHIICHRL